MLGEKQIEKILEAIDIGMENGKGLHQEYIIQGKPIQVWDLIIQHY